MLPPLQTRSAQPCTLKFADLASTCSDTAGKDPVCPADMPADLCPIGQRPFGADPVFNPLNVMFNPAVAGLQSHFYNISEVGPCEKEQPAVPELASPGWAQTQLPA